MHWSVLRRVLQLLDLVQPILRLNVTTELVHKDSSDTISVLSRCMVDMSGLQELTRMIILTSTKLRCMDGTKTFLGWFNKVLNEIFSKKVLINCFSKNIYWNLSRFLTQKSGLSINLASKTTFYQFSYRSDDAL